jgi:ABC-2 type transport system permease protein
MAKVFPIGLGVLALLPATVQLAIAALAPAEFELVRPENHFGYVQIVVALFCAVAAPEVFGRDQRNHTLALYFSRALSRVDYVTAKLGALAVALLIILITPQVLLLLGNAVSTEDLTGYLGDNIDLLAPILASALLIAVFMSSMSCLIAVQTSKRALATGAIVAYFIVATTISNVLIETTTGSIRDYFALIGPFNLLEGAIYWIFDAPPSEDSEIAGLGLDGVYYVLAALAYSAVSLALLFRRFLRLPV